MTSNFLKLNNIEQKNIFFDCFNTIICRTISPKEVLFNFAKEVGETYSIEPAVVYNLLIKIKTKMAIKNKLQLGESETKFTEVLKNLAEYLKKYITNLDTNLFVEKSLNFYIEEEKKCQLLNDSIIVLLQDLKNRGKKLYVVSDFYCGKEIIELFLQNLNVLEYFDDIFVSCDFTASKRTGKLYKKVLDKLQINKKDAFMIGDNLHSDYVKAKSNGIKAKRIKTTIQKSNKHLKHLIKYGINYQKFNEIFNNYGKEYNYSNYAFPLFLFAKRLLENLEKTNQKNVFFFAREGQFLKKLFETYCEITNQGKDIKTHYLYVSRNSVFVASLKPLNAENFSFLLNETKTMSLKKFLTSLNFSDENIKIINEEIQGKLTKKYHNFAKKQIFKKLIENQTFINIYNQKRQSQRSAFEFYLKSFNIDFEKEGMNVVDVGWKGTIQDLVNKFFDGKVKINGYYIGCKKPINTENTKRGLIYHKGKNKYFGNSILHHKMYDYEQVCRADHNRVDGYAIEDNKAKIIYDTTVDDNKQHKEVISLVQNQVFEKFKEICKLDYKYCSYIEVIAVKAFCKMTKNTSKKDTEWLLKCENSHYDNFARIGFTFSVVNDKLLKFAYKIWNFAFIVWNGIHIKNTKIKY